MAMLSMAKSYHRLPKHRAPFVLIRAVAVCFRLPLLTDIIFLSVDVILSRPDGFENTSIGQELYPF
jgi:hypothetical protein